MAILSCLLVPAVLIGAVVISTVAIPAIVIGNLIRRLCTDGSLPQSLPWVGCDGSRAGMLSRAKANLTSLFGMKTLIDEGYTKVCDLCSPVSAQ